MFAADPAGSPRSDVYSLSATLYTLLARRSPYERPGGSNSVNDLVDRIERSPLPA
jgi:serine/threonine protein kinase